MIAAVAATQQRLLFNEWLDDQTEERQTENQKRKNRTFARTKKKNTPGNARKEVQISLFDKHDAAHYEAEVKAYRRRQQKRLADLMDLPEYALTKSELAELDAIVADGCARIQAKWSPKIEAKRRGYAAGWLGTDVFCDDHNRILWRVDTEPVSVSVENGECEE